jgi:hypothetical protein
MSAWKGIVLLLLLLNRKQGQFNLVFLVVVVVEYLQIVCGMCIHSFIWSIEKIKNKYYLQQVKNLKKIK